MKILKFGFDKETDNFETLQLEETIKEWLESIAAPFEGYNESIEAFEFKRRDGFIPHSHNRGGLDYFIQTTVAYLMASGDHFGTAIEQWTEDAWDDTHKHVSEWYKERKEKIDEKSDLFHDAVYESCNGDYDGVAWRIRVMYEGQGKLTVFAGYDTDAPYYRFSGKFASIFEQTIHFKTLKGLARQLKQMTKAVEESQNEAKKEKKRA